MTDEKFLNRIEAFESRDLSVELDGLDSDISNLVDASVFGVKANARMFQKLLQLSDVGQVTITENDKEQFLEVITDLETALKAQLPNVDDLAYNCSTKAGDIVDRITTRTSP